MPRKQSMKDFNTISKQIQKSAYQFNLNNNMFGLNTIQGKVYHDEEGKISTKHGMGSWRFVQLIDDVDNINFGSSYNKQ